MTRTPAQPDVLHFADDASRNLVESLGLSDFHDWFTDPTVNVWRDIRERQNATFDLPDGKRLHVKRLRPPTGREVLAEVEGVRLLNDASIHSIPLVCWGVGGDGSGVLVSRDLTGYEPADRQIAAGRPFSSLAKYTASAAGRLHKGGLHHRDLYLCHFLMSDATVRLIDAARVQRLPWLTRRRWIVKDLAQFRYSGLEVGVGEDELDDWLRLWAGYVGTDATRWRDAVRRKTSRIARHDLRLREHRPERRTSLES